MYDSIRKLHLYTGLVILVFLMMYFVSGYVMVHRSWFGGTPSQPAREVRTESLSDANPDARTPESVAERLRLRGRITATTQTATALTFNVTRPGTLQQVDVPRDGASATITTTTQNLSGILVQLHRVHGYGGGLAWKAFVLFNDLAAASCILFACSGVYLWWKTARRKIWGVLCLGASCAYGVGMVLYLMLA